MKDPEFLRIRCNTCEEAQRVVALLLSRNLPAACIRLLSSMPIQDLGDSVAGKSRLPVFVITGAMIGALAGCALASVTARLYPLNTGGMPIVSWLPVGIVTYETMMLMAVLFTLAGLLFETKLLRRRPPHAQESMEAVGDGEIQVVVQVRSQSEFNELRVVCEQILKAGI